MGYTLNDNNKKELFFDLIGDAISTAVTCDALYAISCGRVDDITLCLLTAGVLGSYVFYNDTALRADALINHNIHTEEGMKLIRRK